jgi:Zn-dependent protease with chaperone function
MQAVDAARQVLPFWVEWGGVLFHVPAAFLVSLAAASLGALLASMPLRGLWGGGWTQKARLAFAVRITCSLGLLSYPVIFGVTADVCSGPLSNLPPVGIGTAVAAAALLAALIVRLRWERRFHGEPLTVLAWLRGGATVWLLLFPHIIVGAILVAILPGRMDLRAALIIAAGLAALTGCAWGGGLLLARWLGLARPASSRLAAIVEAVSQKVGVRPKALYELCWSKANAFAFPLARRLAFTERAVRAMKDDELAAIAAHELGHLGESRLTAAARSAGIYVILPLAAARPVIGSFGFYAFAACVVLVLLVVMSIRRMARKMEERADAVARAHEEESGTYARALERLYEVNLIPAVMPGKRRIHPHLYDRLAAAGARPAYPRPRPPSRDVVLAASLAGALLAAAVSVGLRTGIMAGSLFAQDSEPALLFFTALDGGSADRMADLACLRWKRGDGDGAYRLYEAAAELDSNMLYMPANQSIRLSMSGNCREADALLALAVRLMRKRGVPPDDPVLDDARRAWLECAGQAAAGR